MEHTVIKNIVRNVMFCLVAASALSACGGGESHGASNAEMKLLADGEACRAGWSATQIYLGGNTVSYAGRNYTAAYWTQNNAPSTSSGPAGSGQPWIPGFVCGGVATTSTTKPITTTTKAATTSTSSTTTSTNKTTTSTTRVTTCPTYVAGTAYVTGTVVTNAGGYYSCTVAGWCSTGASAYEPGVGWAWTSAWSIANSSACGGGVTTTTTATTTTKAVTTTTKAATTTTTSTTSTTATNQALMFYVDPGSNAVIWVNNNPGDGRTAAIKANIADKPTAMWFGEWIADIGAAVNAYVGRADALKQMPLLVAYNIPGRDCGQYSAGGAGSIAGYQTWIHSFAAAIGQRKALVILEPDAIPQLDCLSAEGKTGRVQMIQYAINQFKTLAPNAWLYLDIGNSGWLTANDAANRLISVGIANVHGFSLNVSNYKTDAESNAYGIAINNALQQQQGFTKAFVVDTSRNGNGPGSTWCDPAGRKLGVAPKQNAAGSQPEMTLWVKPPGNADGCAGTAGTFIPEMAYKLIYGT